MPAHIVRRTFGLTLATTLVIPIGALAQPATPKPATPAVRAVHDAARRDLPFANRQDFDDARRGFIATVPDADRAGRYAFLAPDEAPDTVHPSLWRSRS
jgi:alkyl sulfatase BDS1-like metallo-beta-lactamase superfamily hydrolase